MRAGLRTAVCAITIAFTAVAHADTPAMFADPDMPPAKRIVEKGQSPRELRLPRDGLDWGVRANFGPTRRLEIGREIGRTAFAFDLLVGAALPFRRGGRWGLFGETGYSYVGFSEHLVSLGVGPLLRGVGPSSPFESTWSKREANEEPPEGLRGVFSFALVPRLVGGLADGQTAVGMRTSAIAGLWFFALELSHQYLSTETRDVHQIAFAFSVWPYTKSLR